MHRGRLRIVWEMDNPNKYVQPHGHELRGWIWVGEVFRVEENKGEKMGKL